MGTREFTQERVLKAGADEAPVQMTEEDTKAVQSLASMFKADRVQARKEGSSNPKVEALYTAVLDALEKPSTNEVVEAVGELDDNGKKAVSTMITGIREDKISVFDLSMKASNAGEHSEPVFVADPDFAGKPVMDKILDAAQFTE